MKTKTSKKVLSFLLAALMAVTALPFTAVAATDADLANLKSAVTAYEAKMDGTVYTNMQEAYQAYIFAKECIDSYTYGGNKSIDLTSPASALTTATAAMAVWAPITADAQWDSTKSSGSFYVENDNPNDIGNTNPSDYYQGLIYAPVVDDAHKAFNEVQYGDGRVRAYMFYRNNVMLYDGVTTPTMPVMTSFYTTSAAFSYVNRYMYSMYPSDANGNDFNGLSLTGYWSGSDSQKNHVWLMNEKARNASGYNKATGYMGNLSGDHRSDVSRGTVSKGPTRYLANTMQFTGTFASGEYSKALSPYWYGSCSEDANTGNAFAQATDYPIYVINYKAVKDALGGIGNILQNVKNYDLDSADMASFLGAADAAGKINPKSYDYASNTGDAVASCAAAINTAVDGITNGKASLTGSSEIYNDLRNAITTTTSTYDYGNDNVYTDDSWSAFDAAYKNAQAAINNTVGNGYPESYNGTAITAVTANLLSAYNALETLVTLADVTEMKAAIAKANTVESCKQYLTAESRAVFETAFTNAKAAFTNSDPTMPTIYTQEQQVQLDALTAALNAALAGIQLDTTALAEKLATIKAIDQTTVFDPVGLTSSIANAQKAYDAAVDVVLTPENIVSITTSYQAACDDTDRAIEYAYQPYQRQQDAVIKTGPTQTAMVSYNGYNNKLTFSYPTGIVLVKTTIDQTSFNIGQYGLHADCVSGKTGYTQKIFELGISNTTDFTDVKVGTLKNGNFRLNFHDGNGSFAKSGDESVAGGMYFDGIDVPTEDAFNTGLQDGKEESYLWYKENTFDITADVTYTAPRLPYGNTPTTKTDTSKTSYAYVYGKYYILPTNIPTQWTTVSVESPIDVTVVDIGPLTYYLDNMVQQYVDLNAANDYKWYTEASYNAFATQFSRAKVLSNNGCINTYETPEAYGKDVATCYTALKAAILNLKVANYTTTFSYKDASGTDVKSTQKGNYGVELTNIPVPATYVNGNYRYVFTGWDKDFVQVDGKNIISGDITYTAQYRQELNLADFTALDAAVNTLTTQNDRVYTTDSLQKLDAYVKSLTYYNYSAEQRETTYADAQPAINTELSAVNAYVLTNPNIDASVADKLTEALAGLDSDANDLSLLDDANFFTKVNVNGNVIEGINYATQSALDAAIAAAITAASNAVRYYNVYLNGSLVGNFAYGSSLEVNGDGTYQTDPDTEVGQGDVKYAWYYSFKSVQVENQTTPKYMVTSNAFGFIVKGDTYLTTTKVEGSEEEKSYAVKFVNDVDNKTIGVLYSENGQVTMPRHTSYAFYTFTGWSNGAQDGDLIDVYSDMTITAQYTAQTKQGYSIEAYNVAYDTIISDTYSYNDKITVSDPDAYAWVVEYAEVYVPLDDYGLCTDGDGTNVTKIEGTAEAYADAGIDPRFGMKVLAFGTEYTFNACEDVIIVAYDEATFMDSVPYAVRACDSFGSNIYDKYTGNLKDPNASTDARKYYKFSDYTSAMIDMDQNSATSAIRSEIVTAETKFSMIGQFSVPDNATVVETGILFTTAADKTLTLANASTDKTIKRLKSSKHTGTSTQYGQFVISVTNPKASGSYKFSYRSYCTYKIDGVSYTVYSENTPSSTITIG